MSMLITYVFCLVICIGKVVTRRACGWRTRQFLHLQPPFPLQILPRKSIKSFFLAFVVLVDISRSHPVHTSFLFIRFSMRFGRFSERFLLCERGARSSYSNHSAAEPPAEQYGAAQGRYWQSLKGYYKITVALRPSYKGDIYCKWYVIMFGLWLFECFTPPLISSRLGYCNSILNSTAKRDVAYAMAIVLTSPYVLGYQFPYGSQPEFENKCQLINMRSLHLATRMG